MFRRKQSSSLTYINAMSEIQGDLNVEGNLRVDGVIYGAVNVQGDMELSRTGLIVGPELCGHNVIIHGVVKAQIRASGRLTLGKTAQIEGNVTAKSLDIAAGAFYTGHLVTEANEVRALPMADDGYPELASQEERLYR